MCTVLRIISYILDIQQNEVLVAPIIKGKIVQYTWSVMVYLSPLVYVASVTSWFYHLCLFGTSIVVYSLFIICQTLNLWQYLWRTISYLCSESSIMTRYIGATTRCDYIVYAWCINST